MGADNAIDLVQKGRLMQLADDSTPAAARTRAHFRGDRARLSVQPRADDTALALDGTVEQAAYLGHGWRYRVRVGRGQVWVDDPAQVPEGSHTHVIVPRDALLLFPAAPQ
jgi:hypothetical protein